MATLDAQAPDGKTLSIDVPEGTPESAYPHIVEEAVQHYVSQPGALESGVRGAINNLPGGGQLGALGTGLMEGKNYSQGMQDFNQKAQEAKAAHPVAYGTGATAGSLAPLAIPVVGEAMEAAPIATGAGLGALNAVGNTDIVQNPELAAKQGIEGAITGGAIGAVMPSGEKMQEGLENYANRKTVEGSGIPADLLNKPKEDIERLGQTMHDMGLTKGTLDDKINIAQANLKQVGEQIGALGAGVPPLQDATPFINQLHDKIQESNDIFGPGANPEAPLYQKGVDLLSQPGLTFEKLQQMKSAIGQRAYDAVGNPKNDAAANLYNVYKDAMKSIVDASPEEYQGLMDKYGDLLDINEALGKTRGRTNAGGMPAKAFGMLGKLGAMVTGGNIPATVAASAALAPAHPFMAASLMTSIANNPNAMSAAARGLAGAVPTMANALKLTSNDAVTTKLMQMITTNPQSLGKYMPGAINAAKTGGSQGLGVWHFLTALRDPEYNSMIMGDSDANR